MVGEEAPLPAEYLPTSQELELDAELHGHDESQLEALLPSLPEFEHESKSDVPPAAVPDQHVHQASELEEASLAF